jgi:tetratricopeptide (TPR) repeat protein
MKFSALFSVLSLLALAGPSAAQKTAQTSSGNCSPNVSNAGAGNVTIQFVGSACQGIDQASVKRLNAFLATYPQEQRRLLELLNMKDIQLGDKVKEVAALTAKYEESSKQLESIGRPEHIAKLVQMNAVSAADRTALDGTIRELEGVIAKTGFELTPENLVRLGWYCTMIAEYEKAIAFFLDATKQNPSLGSAYFGLAYASQLRGNEFLQRGDPDHAKEALDKAEGYAKIARQYDEFDDAALVQLGYTEKDLAQVYSDKGMAEKASQADENAARHFKMVIGGNPQDAGAHNGLGNIYYDKGDIEGAIREYQTATSLADKYTFAWYDLVLVLQQKYATPGLSREESTETFRKLVSALKKVLELSQDPEAQKLPQPTLEKMLELAKWATAEAAKFK